MTDVSTAEKLVSLSGRNRRERLAKEAADALRVRMQRTLFEDVADVAIHTDTLEPGGFLASVMAGWDPRSKGSRIGLILHNVLSRGAGELPTPGEWEEIADLLLNHPMILGGEFVPLELSERAAGKLLPFIYSKPAPVKEESSETDAAPAVVKPLTDEEIERFKEFWDNEY